MASRKASKAAASSAASLLGRRGARKGGLARARALTPARRAEIARMGAAKTNRIRWGRRRKAGKAVGS
jgi:hypothetical protein